LVKDDPENSAACPLDLAPGLAEITNARLSCPRDKDDAIHKMHQQEVIGDGEDGRSVDENEVELNACRVQELLEAR
jgi:hypothetical protein